MIEGQETKSMSSLSSFDQMLTYASSKIAQMSEEFERHHDKLPQSELKTMTDQLKKTHKTLTQAMQGKEVPEYDQSLLKSIISFINKIKKNTTAPEEVGARRSQKVIFLDALTDFQSLLKDLQKKKKSGSSSLASKVKKQPVVKIGGIKRKAAAPAGKELDKHLTLAESKLANLKVAVSESSGDINQAQFKEVTSALQEANDVLKQNTTSKVLSGQYRPDYNRKTMRKILDEINFLHKNIDLQVRAGAAQMQSNLFWSTLKEFHNLLQTLEELKKTRGKTVARVETDLMSR